MHNTSKATVLARLKTQELEPERGHSQIGPEKKGEGSIKRKENSKQKKRETIANKRRNIPKT